MSKCDLPLHGLTVVVESNSSRIYIGRFDVEDERGVLLRDVDVRDLEATESVDDYVGRTIKFGVARNTDQIRVPRSEIASLRRLSEFH